MKLTRLTWRLDGYAGTNGNGNKWPEKVKRAGDVGRVTTVMTKLTTVLCAVFEMLLIFNGGDWVKCFAEAVLAEVEVVRKGEYDEK